MDFKLNVAVNEITKHVFNFFYDDKERRFGKTVKENEDIHGDKFNVIINFMEDNVERVNISYSLLDLISEGGKDVKEIIKYIINNLNYNSNVLILKGVTLSNKLNIAPPRISKALKYLKDKEVITKAKSLRIWKDNPDIDDNLYIVNIDYLYKGNINEIVKQFEKQKQIFDALLNDSIEEKEEQF